MRSRRDGTDPGLLFDGANELKDNPQDEDRPCRQPDPSEPYKSPSHQELDTCLRKIECVKRNHAGNAAARTDAWRPRSRIESDMREIPNERGQCDQHEITKWPEKIFNIIAKDKEEIHVADEVNDSDMQKK